MKDLLEYIVKQLVANPEDVSVTEHTEDNVVSLKLQVNKDDMGIVIGKSGHTIKAIRRLLVARAMADRSNLRVDLSVVEQ